MKADIIKKVVETGPMKLPELLETANYFIQMLAPSQPSDRVSERLTERTLRYYISQGLVDRPLGKEGASAVYGRRHLLQVLVLKKLQSEYMPVKKIMEITPVGSDEKLAALLEDHDHVEFERRRALDFLDSVGGPAAPGPASKAGAGGFLSRSGSASFPPSPSARRGPDRSTWERHNLHDGLEVHIRADLQRRLEAKDLRTILINFKKMVTEAAEKRPRLSQWKREEKND